MCCSGAGIAGSRITCLLTVCAQVVVEELEEREAVPGVGRLHVEHGVHVDGEERPEHLGVVDEQLAVPGQRLVPTHTHTHSSYILYTSAANVIGVCVGEGQGSNMSYVYTYIHYIYFSRCCNLDKAVMIAAEQTDVLPVATEKHGTFKFELN